MAAYEQTNIQHPDVTARFCDELDAGHPNEYIVHVEGAGQRRYISDIMSRRIAQHLEGWDVSNRGTRIEIIRFRGNHRDDATIVAAINAATTTMADDNISLLR